MVDRESIGRPENGRRYPVISRPGNIDLGDVVAQEPAVGRLKLPALDYGDRIHLPLPFRKAIEEGNPDVENRCSVIHFGQRG